MSAAISLAQEGYAVTIHEKNAKIGGKLNVLKEQGYTFDLGPSILTLPHIFERLFERIGQEDERLHPDPPAAAALAEFLRGRQGGGPLSRARTGWPRRRARSAKTRTTCERFLKYSADLYDLSNAGYFEQGLDNCRGLREVLRPVEVSSSSTCSARCTAA